VNEIWIIGIDLPTFIDIIVLGVGALLIGAVLLRRWLP
jgi:hypothetical protein